MTILMRNSEHVADCLLLNQPLDNQKFFREVRRWLGDRRVRNVERLGQDQTGTTVINLTLEDQR